MQNSNQNKSKPSLSKEEMLKRMDANPNINKDKWGQATVKSLKKATK